LSKIQKQLAAAISVLVGVLIFVILSIVPFGKGTGTRAAAELLTIESPGVEVLGNEKVTLDISNISQGYFTAKYDGDNPRVKVSVKNGNSESIFDLKPDEYGEYEALPLTDGSGTYEIIVYEHKYDTMYTRIYEDTIETELRDELLPFLHPSNMVEYSGNSYVVQKAAELAKPANSDFEVVEEIYNYLADAYEYDYESPAIEQTQGMARYVPDVDSSLMKGKGICMDYAVIMAAMLRSQGVPTRLVIGRTIKNLTGVPEETDHAWVSVYISETELSGAYAEYAGGLPGWGDLDPTYGAAAGRNKNLISEYAEYIPVEYF